MQRLRLLLAGALALALSTACAAQPVAPPSAEVGAAIAAAWRVHLEAAIGKDRARIAEIYAPDAVFVSEGAPEVRGRPALDEMEARSLELFDVLSATHTTHELLVAGELAYELGTIVGPLRGKNAPERLVTYHFMAQWRRQPDGSWRIAHLVGAVAP